MLRHFGRFLVVDGPRKIFELWRLTAANFEAEISVVSTAKNLGKPLFQDYSREGRFIGFFLRLGRIVIGILIQAILLLIFIALVIIWLLLPALIIYEIFVNLAGLSTLNKLRS